MQSDKRRGPRGAALSVRRNAAREAQRTDTLISIAAALAMEIAIAESPLLLAAIRLRRLFY